jgi:DNA-binding NarL/FixJ family response regulator
MRAVIVEDHAMFREAIRRICEQDCGCEVVGEAETGAAAVALIRTTRPDVVLLDLNLPDGDGFSVIEEVRKTPLEVRIVVLSSHCDDFTLHRVRGMWVQAFVDKNTQTAANLRTALAAVARGHCYYSPAYQEARSRCRADTRSFLKLLTDRELEVLTLVGQGMSNDEIARQLKRGRKTIETHRSNLMHKLDLHSTRQLIHFALESGVTQVQTKRGSQRVYF